MGIAEKINGLKLSSLNKYAFLLHLISGIVVAGVLYGAVGDINFNTTIYGYKLDTITSDGKDVTFIFGEDGPKVDLTSDQLKGIVVAIFLLTAAFHYYYWKSKRYVTEVNSGKNRFRWIEYAITASLMIFIYNVISGVKDLYTVFLLVLFNIVMMAFGYFLEMSPGAEGKKVAILMGFFILTIIFAFSYYQFVSNLERAKRKTTANPTGFDIPDWVYAVVIAMVFWWISFGVVGVLYYKASLKGKVDFKRYERYYILLSFLSKAFMGYYITFGLTRDSPKPN